MNDKVMLSIHHKYAELIFSGQKTLEIRKTAPSCSYPYIIYMYETKRDGGAGAVVGFFKCNQNSKEKAFKRNYTDTEIIKIYREDIAERACLTTDELTEYANGKEIYALSVSIPIRFPRPRPLSDFGLTRAPQSWQYLK